MKLLRLATPFVLSLLLCACAASGPRLADMKSSIPTLQADSGRIYFYRNNNYGFGGGLRPSVRLNGNVVGDSKPGGFFYVDAKPGAQEVATTTEVERKLTFELAAGETRYVRTSVTMGLLVGHVYPELVDQAAAEKELEACAYTGK